MTEDLKFTNSTETIYVVFYKGPGTMAEQIVRMWTKSPYSHCEFGRSDGLYHSNDRFTLISRIESMNIQPNEWEICTLRLPIEIVKRVERRQLKKNGTAYDWLGIVFSQLFRLGLHDAKRWFCSKSNADDLLYAYTLMRRSHNSGYAPYLHVLEPISGIEPHRLSPHDLFALVRSMERIQEKYPPKCS